jgi:general secretion pathway protein E
VENSVNAAEALNPITKQAAINGQKIKVEDVLRALYHNRIIERTEAKRIAEAINLAGPSESHALVQIAQRQPLRFKPPQIALDLEFLVEWYAGQIGFDYYHIDPLKADVSKIGELMSAAYAERFKILPVEVKPHEVVVATAEPFLKDWATELTQMLRRDVKVVFANPTDISRYIVEFFNLAKTVRDAAKSGLTNNQQNLESLVDMGASGKSFDANDQHIVTIVDWLWQYAFDSRASDIHLEPRRDTAVVRFRIDGVLHNVYSVPMTVLAAMVSRIKLLGRMDVVEKRRPLDGRIKTRTAAGREIELRLATMPTAFGEKMVMRIFDPEVLVKNFSELGFAIEEELIWNEMTSRPNGIVLVTGPTGSGKTTTLYTTLKRLANEEVNVCTVEDPIEMIEPSFNQMQVNTAIELNFSDGVRALMRQDPDIIMVGEIRDLETADMAIQAALTGHLVISTLHTNDAASAVTRLLDLGVAPYLLSATFIGVMAQRLVRQLCSNCKVADQEVSDEDWAYFTKPVKVAKPERLYRPVGCNDCRNTGYRGRVGLYEMLPMSDELRQMVSDKAELRSMRQTALNQKMKPMRVAGAEKIHAGLTTMAEVTKAAPPILG